MNQVQQTIECFLARCRQPVLCEDGAESFAITEDNFRLEDRNGTLRLQVWDERRNLVRRVTAIRSESRHKLILVIEKFGKKTGTLALADAAGADTRKLSLRDARLEFRECFRRFLGRQYPGFKIAELTTEADLEHSLSPAYTRALLKQGALGWAAIGAARESLADGVLTFGLIWLDYVRRREPRLAIQGLILYLPGGFEKIPCLRLLFLDGEAAHYQAFVYTEEGIEQPLDLRDYGNLNTRLEPCRRPLPSALDDTLSAARALPDIETVERSDGELSLRVRGLEFARTMDGEVLCGLPPRRTTQSAGRVRDLARELSRFRCPMAADRMHPLYLQRPEAWLESQVRAQIEQIDARLLAAPVYGQVPAFAAADRSVLDLLAVDRSGRLTVIELKASEDIHLPLQALDYWMRVKWHLDRGEFAAKGYFPGQALRSEPPRLILVSPALQVHPANDTVLRFFARSIEVEQVGVGVEWRKEVEVMFRR